MTGLRLIYALVLGLSVTATAAGAGCGDSAAPCRVSGGTYHAVLPDVEPRGAVIFLHGLGGSGTTAIGNRNWVPEALRRGYAVIAPDGMPMDGRKGLRWYFHPDWPQARDEITFLLAVRDDAIARFGFDGGRIALGGFSIGGSMTHYLACTQPDAFYAYVPIGGAFWRPTPDRCAGTVRLLHAHGWADKTVPLEGRVVRGGAVDDPGALVQGDVFEAMQVWRRTNECRHLLPDQIQTEGAFWRREWRDCAPDSALDLALFPGGHQIPPDWAALMLDWLEEL